MQDLSLFKSNITPQTVKVLLDKLIENSNSISQLSLMSESSINEYSDIKETYNNKLTKHLRPEYDILKNASKKNLFPQKDIKFFEQTNSLLHLKASNNDPQFVIIFDFEEEADYVLSIDLEVPSDTNTEIFLSSKTQNGYRGDRKKVYCSFMGRNKHMFQFKGKDIARRIRVDVGQVEGDYYIREFKLHKYQK